MYCMYLRKSRADAEAEAHGEGETLARHERILLELANKLGLTVSAIYREVVSGETIASRPVMQQLLHEVEQETWNGVLVMEVERLARGDTIDQGIVAQTFKYSRTKIITPTKTYDPNNEFDEEYFEFGLFMSRREYKTINRRLQQGRTAAVKEGKWVSNKVPYGYERVKLENDKGWTLQPIPIESAAVRLMFELYTTGERQPDGTIERIGTSRIASRLRALNIPTQSGKPWSGQTIRDILINPVYIGKIRWNWRHNVRSMENGRIKITSPRSNDAIIANGLHPAIIDQSVFELAQEYMTKNPPRPVADKATVKSSLCGLVKCGFCNHNMFRRPYSRNMPPTLICTQVGCKCVSSYFNIVEERILTSLCEWLKNYKLQWDVENSITRPTLQADLKNKSLQRLQARLDTLHQQINRTHDLLEQGIYDTDTFLSRNRTLSDEIQHVTQSISTMRSNINTTLQHKEDTISIIPVIEHPIEVYKALPTPQEKNDMLKEILEVVLYKKTEKAKRSGSIDDFEIIIYPKIPTASPKQ